MKSLINEKIEKIAPELLSMADNIFDNPEIGLEEFKSSELLIDYLEKNDFSVEKGIGGFETAFKATYEIGEGDLQ